MEGNEEYWFISRSVSPFVDEADWIGSLDGDYARPSCLLARKRLFDVCPPVLSNDET